MSKGRYAKKQNNTKKWILLLVLVAVLAALVVFVLKDGGDVQLPEEMQASENTAAATENQTVPDETAGSAEIREPEVTDAPAGTDAPAETQAPSAAQTEAPADAPKPTAPPVVTTEPPPVQIIQRADAEYEKWLAATMIVCVSMEYPDFQLEGVYAASATALEDAMNSQGAYILFTSGGQKLAIHSKPLSEERTAAGTKDISSQTLGFASYDLVSAASVDTAALTQIKLEELGELISQSVLVTIYEH